MVRGPFGPTAWRFPRDAAAARHGPRGAAERVGASELLEMNDRLRRNQKIPLPAQFRLQWETMETKPNESLRRRRAQSTTREIRVGEMVVRISVVPAKYKARRTLSRPAGASHSGSATSKKPLTAQALLQSGLVGLWSHRKDLPDSPEFARSLRRKAERRELP
jgi:hypothetical protein